MSASEPSVFNKPVKSMSSDFATFCIANMESSSGLPVVKSLSVPVRISIKIACLAILPIDTIFPMASKRLNKERTAQFMTSLVRLSKNPIMLLVFNLLITSLIWSVSSNPSCSCNIDLTLSILPSTNRSFICWRKPLILFINICSSTLPEDPLSLSFRRTGKVGGGTLP